VLERVQELRHQLQSFVRHQQALRDGTRAEHAEMVQEASTTVVQQRVAFLTRIKVSVIQFGGMNVLQQLVCITVQEKLSAIHQTNQRKLKEGRKLALVGNATKHTESSHLSGDLFR
jgi:hypothetical protein